MNTVKVWFKNFWPNFDPYNNSCLSYFEYYFNKFGYNVVVNNKKPNIVVYSVFSRSTTDAYSFVRKNTVKILYIRENIYDHWYKDIYPKNLNKYQYIIGYENDPNLNKYYLSDSFILYKLYDTKNEKYEKIISNSTNFIEQKSNDICFIHSNRTKVRQLVLDYFKTANIHVDCYGRMNKNTIFDNQEIYATKYQILSKYIFNLCLENSYYPGYTTEKLFDASLCGCIPVYWGCNNFGNNFYNDKKILFINKDLDNLPSITEQIKKLQHDQHLLKEKLSLSPYNKNIKLIIEEENLRHEKLFQKIIYDNKL